LTASDKYLRKRARPGKTGRGTRGKVQGPKSKTTLDLAWPIRRKPLQRASKMGKTL